MNVKRLSVVAIIFMLLGCVGILQCPGGSVKKAANGSTIIDVTVFGLPDPTDNSPANRASIAVMNAFLDKFPEIFAKRYKSKYKADPEKYGKFNWDKVAVDLNPFSALRVEGVETDLLAIAGGMAPDILYINFRKSDNYIQNNFLYPLDGYLKDLSKEEFKHWVNPKIWPVIHRKGSNGKINTWAMPTGVPSVKSCFIARTCLISTTLIIPTMTGTGITLCMPQK